MKNYKVNESDVLIIGCGGAGLRAAIEVKSSGLSVNIIGKRSNIIGHYYFHIPCKSVTKKN